MMPGLARRLWPFGSPAFARGAGVDRDPLSDICCQFFSWRPVFAMLAIPAVVVAVLNPRADRPCDAAIIPEKIAPRAGAFDLGCCCETLLRSTVDLADRGGIWLLERGYWGFLGWIAELSGPGAPINIKSAGACSALALHVRPDRGLS